MTHFCKSMTYSVKEIYYTLQGEGAQSGRPAVFLRFSGCNLWSGREADRAESLCRFCDTQFVGTDGPGGGKFETAAELAEAARRAWPTAQDRAIPFVVCTGGEPLLQLDTAAIDALARGGIRGRCRKQRHSRSACRHRLAVYQPEGPGDGDASIGRRIEARLSANRGRGPAELFCAYALHAFFPATDGQPGIAGQHASCCRLLSAAPAVAPESADTQDRGHRLTVNHRIGQGIFALLTSIAVAYFAFQWVTDPQPRTERAREEQVVEGCTFHAARPGGVARSGDR